MKLKYFIFMILQCSLALPASGPERDQRMRQRAPSGTELTARRPFPGVATAPFASTGSFQQPGEQPYPVNIQDTASEGSDDTPEQQRHRRRHHGRTRTALQPTQSMWARMLAMVQRTPQATAEERRASLDHSRYPAPEPRKEVHLCSLKFATISTLVLLIAAGGWMSYQDWLQAAALGQLQATTGQLVNTVNTGIAQLGTTTTAAISGLTTSVAGLESP